MHWNLSTASLIEAAVARGDGRLSTNGALVDLFVENFAKLTDHADKGIRQATPKAAKAV